MNESISYFYENAMARQERTIKRLWLLLILIIVLFVASNTLWIVYEKQFETVTETTTQKASTNDGGTAIINGEGRVALYGYGDGKENCYAAR